MLKKKILSAISATLVLTALLSQTVFGGESSYDFKRLSQDGNNSFDYKLIVSEEHREGEEIYLTDNILGMPTPVPVWLVPSGTQIKIKYPASTFVAGEYGGVKEADESLPAISSLSGEGLILIDEDDYYFIDGPALFPYTSDLKVGDYVEYTDTVTLSADEINNVFVKMGEGSNGIVTGVYIIVDDTVTTVTSVDNTPKTTNEIGATVDGVQVVFDQAPVIQDGRTLVPMRAIFEAMGANVEWDGDTRTVTGTKGDTVVKMTIDNSVISVNGNNVTLDVAPTIINGRTMVPARAVAEAFNAKVEWDNATRTVIITQ